MPGGDPRNAEAASDLARVFFALWPDEPVRAELDRIAAELHRLRGGRRARSETIHLTLVFVGNVPRTTLPALQAAAAEIRLPAFELVLDQAECWRHNRIACVTTSQPPAALIELVTGLEGTLDRLGIPFDRRPYKPHVTLVRNADCRPDDRIEKHAGPPQVFLHPPRGGGLGEARPWGALKLHAGPPQVFLHPPQGAGWAKPGAGGGQIPPIHWSAREFVLVESRLSPEGTQYPQLGRYPLM